MANKAFYVVQISLQMHTFIQKLQIVALFKTIDVPLFKYGFNLRINND